ncbi:hypothetical protein M3N64_06020 [Sporolactobacillus sp. CPB3-1]|uniref:DUF2268 domain-containing protein n=1 Tax=Sporolactobacillus mangiferae TaxID=2940498 RepID=A0ABT0M9F3_9BACL|nr:hypothetical protein [Sporolactobacillus mangiferae]MCL1631505.1 hypothetical protein [Sporolactobacillus mangiferae]
MNIDDTIFQKYLNEAPLKDYVNAWIFHQIEEKQYLFDVPDKRLIPVVQVLYNCVEKAVLHFTPCKQKLWRALFSDYNLRLQDYTIHRVVGCPAPYEAMVRQNTKRQEVIVFDLIRLSRYGIDRAQKIIQAMMTHECAHILLHQDYVPSAAETYKEKLLYMRFDEGLAHFLATNKKLSQAELACNKEKAKQLFQQALHEREPKKQDILLRRACSGPYWKKFACITGMFEWADLYAASGINGMLSAYQRGWQLFGSQ